MVGIEGRFKTGYLNKPGIEHTMPAGKTDMQIFKRMDYRALG
jgi:hypothetical protein